MSVTERPTYEKKEEEMEFEQKDVKSIKQEKSNARMQSVEVK